MSAKKKPLRPVQDVDKFYGAIKNSQDNFLIDTRQMEEAAATKQFLQLPTHKVITSISNTRTLPIKFDRFMEIEWPAVDDPAYRVKLRAIVNVEKIHNKYTKLSALRFYEKVYLLAKDLLAVGLSQPIGVIEVSPNEYALVWGQRRFMATYLASLVMIDAVIIEAEITNSRLIAHIQDSENDLKDDPVLVDRIEAKRKKWVEYTARNARVIKRDLFDFMGVNRTDGAILLKIFNSTYEDDYLEMIRENHFTTFGSLRAIDFDVEPGKKALPKSVEKVNRNAAPALRSLGVNLNKGCEITLIKFFIETSIKSGALSEDVLNKLKGEDLSNREGLNKALRAVADGIYAK
jgi:hypothetical protein